MRIGLVAEVKWEVREVVRQLRMRKVASGDETYRAQLNGHEILLCLSGMEPKGARERVQRFLGEHKPELMICSGLAGALQPQLNAGDLVVHSTDSDLVGMTETALNDASITFHVGPLKTMEKPVLTPEARRALAAESDAIAVDMESQTVAALCREAGIKCLAIKGVSDEMDDDLSPILGGYEVIHIPTLAMHVLFKPKTWPLAAQLAKQTYTTATALGQGVLSVLKRVQH